LVAGCENPVHNGVRESACFFNTEERVPLGVGFIGRIATTGRQAELRNLEKARGEFSVLGSLPMDEIRQCVGTAISFRDEILGVLAIFARVNATKDRLAWQQIFSNHFGAAIANARAFEEIRVAGKRLEQANQTLERELAERKAGEEKLRESEQRYRRIVETASEGIWELDEQYTTTLVNRRMAEMLGYEPKEMVGRNLHEFLFEDDQAGMSARIAARRQGLTERYEQGYRRKDGSTVCMYVSATSMFDAEHRFLGSFAMLMDITERKRAFEEIQRLKAQLEMQNAYLEEEVVVAKAFGELVGQSRALHNIVKQIDLVAPTEASALILGESGTGKELVAREIHQRSRRKDKPLVRVNCASIPKDLFESEFFGHTRGAFTGAVKDRAGRFEAAEGGTIFLDEIGEVPLDLQSKLLRVLQEKCYERVGEDRTRQADVRVVAATNHNLQRQVEAGRFREDLFYRLNVFPVQVPPLRERMEDVPLLAKHFIETSVRELGCPKPRLTRAGITKLENYHWPGNIRELRNVIERAIILSRGGALDFDLPVTESAVVPSRHAAHAKSEVEPEFLTEAELQRRERKNLMTVLEKTHWKIKGENGAAELLGVKATTLKARIKKMGLKRPN
jgi:PAS domain S-box-containing protein